MRLLPQQSCALDRTIASKRRQECGARAIAPLASAETAKGDPSFMFDVRHHERIDSTNDEARRLAEAGAPHGTVVYADQQTAGRGRLARRWYSPPGNLYISILLRYDLPPGRAGELSFLSSLAVADTVDALLPKQQRAMLKWPNDVLVDGAKISGILVEQAGDAIVIGIGLNVVEAPATAGYATTTLAASGGIATMEGARTILLQRMAEHLATWEAEGFLPIRTAWLARSHPLGEPLSVTAGGRSVEGVFVGLDADGALLLDTGSGRERVVAGDVSIGPPPLP
jgi:BirA family biotin operon repressor/biotin-[acetyl-CoA-carboxylase] ligase